MIIPKLTYMVGNNTSIPHGVDAPSDRAAPWPVIDVLHLKTAVNPKVGYVIIFDRSVVDRVISLIILMHNFI